MTVGKLDDDQRRHHERAGLLLRARRPAPGSPHYPADALPKAERGVPGRILRRACDSGLVALYQKCPHLGCRVPSCVTQPVVRVPVPRLAVQPGRREEGRPGAARHGPLPDHDRRQRRRHDRHRHDRAPGRRSAPTPPARRPRARTASPVAASTDDVPDGRRSPTTARSRGSSSRSSSSASDRLRRLQRTRRRARSSARRSSWPPTASRTTTTRCSEGKRLERVQLVGVLLLVVIVDRAAALLGARADPSGRAPEGMPDDRLAGWGVELFAADGGRRLQLRRLPRRHEGHRRRRAVHRHRSGDRRGPGGQLDTPRR